MKSLASEQGLKNRKCAPLKSKLTNISLIKLFLILGADKIRGQSPSFKRDVASSIHCLGLKVKKLR